MVYQIVIILIIVFIFRYIVKQIAARRLLKKQVLESFLVPKEGGVLQKMRRDADGNIKLKLGKKIKISDDTYIFRYSFSDPDHSFGLPIGGHVIFSANIKTKEHPEGELVERKYTPTSTVQNYGYVDFVIKIYRKNVHPRFPEGGIMT